MGVRRRRGWLRLLLHYAESPMRTRGGCALGLVSLPHRVLLWGEGGGHLCLPQLLLAKVAGSNWRLSHTSHLLLGGGRGASLPSSATSR
ncbi:hypothetical protein DAI22_12g164900 [Oryza sativa Japonica Group]|nr:hypothetical protein DAI22_12g164900 [Oryza sativa Japonica Group]